MRLFEINNTLSVDNIDGIGAVPINQNVDYLGLRVQMRPATFLKLAATLNRKQAQSVEYIKQQMKNGKQIAAPWLQLQIPPEWNKNQFKKPAKVVGHEGRNRMYAVMELYGNIPVETHLFFSDGLRNRDINADWIEQLNLQLIPEKISVPISGPFFQI
jgi:hypothetical protein